MSELMYARIDADPEIWAPHPHLRFVRPEGTTTEPDILQQAWQEHYTGRVEWRAVPTILVPAAEYAAYREVQR